MDPVHLLTQTLAVTRSIVDDLRPGDLDRPTPCADWTVRDVLDHVVEGLHASSAIVAGNPAAEVGRTGSPDPVGDDAVKPYQRASEVVLAAFSAPGALERPCATPGGEMAGAEWIWFPIFDVYTHGWDVARGAGIDAVFPDELTAPILAFARSAFGDDRPPRIFDRAVPLAGDAPLMDQLVAHLGRRPDWTATV